MESRVHRRLSIKAAVSLTVEDRRPVHGWIKNVSISGLHVRTDEFLPNGTKCLVTMIVREGMERRRLILPGTVRRRDTEGMGVQFGTLTDEQSQRLSLMILETQGLATP